MARFGTSGGACGGAWPGSSTRSRMLGGTNRPAGRGGAAGAWGLGDWAGAAGAAAGTYVDEGCIGAGGASTTGSSESGAATGDAEAAGADRAGVSRAGAPGASSASVGDATAIADGAETGSPAGAAGFTSAGFLTSRGGPSVGTAGLGGSTGAPGFLAGAPARPLAALTACSEKMSPLGSSMPRCLAWRSTNWRATISSSVLDALFSSMP